MSPDFNFDELRSLSADLGKVANNTGPFINSAFQFTSVLIRDAARDSVKSGSNQWRALPSAIDYEITVGANGTGSVIESEIGYNKDRAAGKLGNIREFGSPSVAPHLDLQTALTDNEADFEKGITQAIDDALKAGGL
ncbi:hypothetical protein E3T43_01270 [Cryobacterium sp. Hh7]|uniref:hypothetical protein n=1 Tax=Cryobacterium sp. Hh7 TaxID=1259159 RepID=UPI00106A015B|nr:hypothetical protein [Cryobacterium sp. Hh7]TFD61129.1 hypothetical protein E3T43_01270 [Cryobacterium sp. Hh7]